MPDYSIGVKFGAEGLTELKKAVTDLNVPFVTLKKNLTGLTFPNINADPIRKAAAELNKIAPAAEQVGNAFDKIPGNVGRSAAAFAGLSTPLQKSAEALKSIPRPITQAGAAITALNPAVGRANLALLNLGRVAQDAPFGLIGIANNIEPLIQSFQALGREAKNNGGVLSALGKSLIGPGGLLLAVSAVSFVASGGIGTIKKFFSQFTDANGDITKAKTFLESLRKSMDIRFEAQGSAQGEIAEVTALAAVVRDETAAKGERLAAIQRLKDINKSYFGDLSLEKSSIDGLKKAQEDYTNALIAQSVIKGFSDEVGKSSVELFRQEKALKAAGVAFLTAQVNASKAQDALGKISVTDAYAKNFASDKLVAANTALQTANKTYQQQLGIVTKLRDANGEYTQEINKAVESSLKLKPLNVPTGSGTKAEVDLLSKRLSYLKDIQKSQQEIANIPVINKQIVAFDTTKLSDQEIEDITGKKKIEQALQDVAALIETSEEIYKLEIAKINIDVKKGVVTQADGQKAKKIAADELQAIFNQQAIILEGTVRVKPAVAVDRVDLSKASEPIESEIAKAFGADKAIPINFSANVGVTVAGTQIRNLAESKEKMEDEFAQYFEDFKFNLKVDVLTSLGEGIGSIGSGEGLKGLISPLVNTLADALSQLGKAMIIYGVKLFALKKAFDATKKFFTSNPAVLIAAGVGAVAAGALIRNQFQKSATPKFKDGGIADGPLSGYNVELHGREMIIPLDRLNNAPSFNSKSGFALMPSIAYSGDGFRIMLNKVDRRKTRL